MDLGKAKSIIIVIMIAFNTFLLFNNFSYYKGQGTQKDTINNAITILKVRGVSLECNIPDGFGNTSRLKFGNGKLDRSAIASRLLGETGSASRDFKEYSNSGKKLSFLSETEFLYTDASPTSKLDIKNQDEIKKYTLEYLKEMSLLPAKYVIDEFTGEDGTVKVTFIEKYRGYLVYDNYCIVTLTDKGITEIDYKKLQITGFSAEKVKDPAAAYQVLLAYFKEDTAGNVNGTVITQMDIGYKFSPDQSMNGMESTELLPEWRIKVKGNSEPIYLNTFDASAI